MAPEESHSSSAELCIGRAFKWWWRGADIPVMRDEAARLRRIIAVQSAIARSAPRLEDVMELIVAEAALLTGADGAAVELAEGDEMVYRAASGSAAPHIGLRLSLHSSLSGLSVRRGEVLRCDDSELDTRVDRDACRRINVRSMVVVPLSADGVAIGVLKVHSPHPQAFDGSDVETLEILAGFVAGSLASAHAYEASVHDASHDLLTGLPNRGLLMARLGEALRRRRRGDGTTAVLFVDLDGFKPVNDTYGHAAGDTVLQEAARRLVAAVRSADTVGRMGGDEFAVVCDGIDQAAAERLVERITAELELPIEIEAGTARVGASVGLATSVDDLEPPETLVARADAAMYRQKGRSRR